MYAAILAGGIGTRLWPRSRSSHPKQFADITGAGRTLIQATADRLEGLVAPESMLVLTGERYQGLVTDQLTALPAENIIVEPSGRNTAPAIGLACVHLRRRDPDAVLVILPADHVIPDHAAFQNALKRAVTAAEQGYLVTLGIEPHFPHTGYGYIQRADVLLPATAQELPVYGVERFLEKPNRTAAEEFVSHGGYYWNGGIFVSRVDVMLREMERQMPEAYRLLDQIGKGLETDGAKETLRQLWDEMPSISIDYGVMEGASQVAVVPLNAGWNDVGSWDALDSVLVPDGNGNVNVNSAITPVDSYNNIVYCGSKMVALVGVDDLVVIDTGDALLIGHRKQMQKVKDVVDRLREDGHQDLL